MQLVDLMYDDYLHKALQLPEGVLIWPYKEYRLKDSRITEQNLNTSGMLRLIESNNPKERLQHENPDVAINWEEPFFISISPLNFKSINEAVQRIASRGTDIKRFG